MEHLEMRAIPECLRGVIMTRRYTNPHLPLPYIIDLQFSHMWCVLYIQNSLTKSCPLDHEKLVACSHPGPRIFTSYNRHFVIKSIQSEQVAEMHRILTAYHQVYIMQLITYISKQPSFLVTYIFGFSFTSQKFTY